ncbi:MFS transporter [Thalassotalea fusca]
MNNLVKSVCRRVNPSSPSNNLGIYIIAAMLARIATGASTIAVVLLAHANGSQGEIVGLLAACITAPHLFGPIYGRWLDNSHDPRRLLAIACFVFTVCFQLSLVGFHTEKLWLTISSLLICGLCSSFMMGGLSTQLTFQVDNDTNIQRRAQSYDTLSYGFGLTVGPLIIAIFSEHFALELTAGWVMTLPVIAGLFVLNLPKKTSRACDQHKNYLSFKQVLETILHSPPLRRTLAMTSGASFSMAALPIMAVFLSEMWMQGKENGAFLVTFYGLGCICGACLLMFKPLKADAIMLLRNVGAVLVVTLILVVLSPNFTTGLIGYWLCGVVNSIFFAVTLAARREYAPEQSAAQIYMWIAAAKISAASLGAFVTGTLLGHSIATTMLVSCTVLILTLLMCFWRRC